MASERGRRRAALFAVPVLLAALTVGCGGGGVSSGATVSVYVAAPLCAGAKQELTRRQWRPDDIRVRAICLAAADRGRRLSLAIVGANARRASEDSAAVGFLAARGEAARFARPIVEEAGIAFLEAGPEAAGSAAAGLLDAVRGADSGSLRASVRDAVRRD